MLTAESGNGAGKSAGSPRQESKMHATPIAKMKKGRK
jgi:hypothetical protein